MFALLSRYAQYTTLPHFRQHVYLAAAAASMTMHTHPAPPAAVGAAENAKMAAYDSFRTDGQPTVSIRLMSSVVDQYEVDEQEGGRGQATTNSTQRRATGGGEGSASVAAVEAPPPLSVPARFTGHRLTVNVFTRADLMREAMTRDSQHGIVLQEMLALCEHEDDENVVAVPWWRPPGSSAANKPFGSSEGKRKLIGGGGGYASCFQRRRDWIPFSRTFYHDGNDDGRGGPYGSEWLTPYDLVLRAERRCPDNALLKVLAAFVLGACDHSVCVDPLAMAPHAGNVMRTTACRDDDDDGLPNIHHHGVGPTASSMRSVRMASNDSIPSSHHTSGSGGATSLLTVDTLLREAVEHDVQPHVLELMSLYADRSNNDVAVPATTVAVPSALPAAPLDWLIPVSAYPSFLAYSSLWYPSNAFRLECPFTTGMHAFCPAYYFPHVSNSLEPRQSSRPAIKIAALAANGGQEPAALGPKARRMPLPDWLLLHPDEAPAVLPMSPQAMGCRVPSPYLAQRRGASTTAGPKSHGVHGLEESLLSADAVEDVVCRCSQATPTPAPKNTGGGHVPRSDPPGPSIPHDPTATSALLPPPASQGLTLGCLRRAAFHLVDVVLREQQALEAAARIAISASPPDATVAGGAPPPPHRSHRVLAALGGDTKRHMEFIHYGALGYVMCFHIEIAARTPGFAPGVVTTQGGSPALYALGRIDSTHLKLALPDGSRLTCDQIADRIFASVGPSVRQAVSAAAPINGLASLSLPSPLASAPPPAGTSPSQSLLGTGWATMPTLLAMLLSARGGGGSCSSMTASTGGDAATSTRASELTAADLGRQMVTVFVDSNSGMGLPSAGSPLPAGSPTGTAHVSAPSTPTTASPPPAKGYPVTGGPSPAPSSAAAAAGGGGGGLLPPAVIHMDRRDLLRHLLAYYDPGNVYCLTMLAWESMLLTLPLSRHTAQYHHAAHQSLQTEGVFRMPQSALRDAAFLGRQHDGLLQAIHERQHRCGGAGGGGAGVWGHTAVAFSEFRQEAVGIVAVAPPTTSSVSKASTATTAQKELIPRFVTHAKDLLLALHCACPASAAPLLMLGSLLGGHLAPHMGAASGTMASQAQALLASANAAGNHTDTPGRWLPDEDQHITVAVPLLAGRAEMNAATTCAAKKATTSSSGAGESAKNTAVVIAPTVLQTGVLGKADLDFLALQLEPLSPDVLLKVALELKVHDRMVLPFFVWEQRSDDDLPPAVGGYLRRSIDEGSTTTSFVPMSSGPRVDMDDEAFHLAEAGAPLVADVDRAMPEGTGSSASLVDETDPSLYVRDSALLSTAIIFDGKACRWAEQPPALWRELTASPLGPGRKEVDAYVSRAMVPRFVSHKGRAVPIARALGLLPDNDEVGVHVAPAMSLSKKKENDHEGGRRSLHEEELLCKLPAAAPVVRWFPSQLIPESEAVSAITSASTGASPSSSPPAAALLRRRQRQLDGQWLAQRGFRKGQFGHGLGFANVSYCFPTFKVVVPDTTATAAATRHATTSTRDPTTARGPTSAPLAGGGATGGDDPQQEEYMTSVGLHPCMWFLYEVDRDTLLSEALRCFPLDHPMMVTVAMSLGAADRVVYEGHIGAACSLGNFSSHSPAMTTVRPNAGGMVAFSSVVELPPPLNGHWQYDPRGPYSQQPRQSTSSSSPCGRPAAAHHYSARNVFDPMADDDDDDEHPRNPGAAATATAARRRRRVPAPYTVLTRQTLCATILNTYPNFAAAQGALARCVSPVINVGTTTVGTMAGDGAAETFGAKTLARDLCGRALQLHPTCWYALCEYAAGMPSIGCHSSLMTNSRVGMHVGGYYHDVTRREVLQIVIAAQQHPCLGGDPWTTAHCLTQLVEMSRVPVDVEVVFPRPRFFPVPYLDPPPAAAAATPSSSVAEPNPSRLAAQRWEALLCTKQFLLCCVLEFDDATLARPYLHLGDYLHEGHDAVEIGFTGFLSPVARPWADSRYQFSSVRICATMSFVPGDVPVIRVGDDMSPLGLSLLSCVQPSFSTIMEADVTSDAHQDSRRVSQPSEPSATSQRVHRALAMGIPAAVAATLSASASQASSFRMSSTATSSAVSSPPQSSPVTPIIRQATALAYISTQPLRVATNARFVSQNSGGNASAATPASSSSAEPPSVRSEAATAPVSYAALKYPSPALSGALQFGLPHFCLDRTTARRRVGRWLTPSRCTHVAATAKHVAAVGAVCHLAGEIQPMLCDGDASVLPLCAPVMVRTVTQRDLLQQALQIDPECDACYRLLAMDTYLGETIDLVTHWPSRVPTTTGHGGSSSSDAAAGGYYFIGCAIRTVTFTCKDLILKAAFLNPQDASNLALLATVAMASDELCAKDGRRFNVLDICRRASESTNHCAAALNAVGLLCGGDPLQDVQLNGLSQLLLSTVPSSPIVAPLAILSGVSNNNPVTAAVTTGGQGGGVFVTEALNWTYAQRQLLWRTQGGGGGVADTAAAGLPMWQRMDRFTKLQIFAALVYRYPSFLPGYVNLSHLVAYAPCTAAIIPMPPVNYDPWKSADDEKGGARQQHGALTSRTTSNSSRDAGSKGATTAGGGGGVTLYWTVLDLWTYAIEQNPKVAHLYGRLAAALPDAKTSTNPATGTVYIEEPRVTVRNARSGLSREELCLTALQLDPLDAFTLRFICRYPWPSTARPDILAMSRDPEKQALAAFPRQTSLNGHRAPTFDTYAEALSLCSDDATVWLHLAELVGFHRGGGSDALSGASGSANHGNSKAASGSTSAKNTNNSNKAGSALGGNRAAAATAQPPQHPSVSSQRGWARLLIMAPKEQRKYVDWAKRLQSRVNGYSHAPAAPMDPTQTSNGSRRSGDPQVGGPAGVRTAHWVTTTTRHREDVVADHLDSLLDDSFYQLADAMTKAVRLVSGAELFAEALRRDRSGLVHCRVAELLRDVPSADTASVDSFCCIAVDEADVDAMAATQSQDHRGGGSSSKAAAGNHPRPSPPLRLLSKRDLILRAVDRMPWHYYPLEMLHLHMHACPSEFHHPSYGPAATTTTTTAPLAIANGPPSSSPTVAMMWPQMTSKATALLYASFSHWLPAAARDLDASLRSTSMLRGTLRLLDGTEVDEQRLLCRAAAVSRTAVGNRFLHVKLPASERYVLITPPPPPLPAAASSAKQRRTDGELSHGATMAPNHHIVAAEHSTVRRISRRQLALRVVGHMEGTLVAPQATTAATTVTSANSAGGSPSLAGPTVDMAALYRLLAADGV